MSKAKSLPKVKQEQQQRSDAPAEESPHLFIEEEYQDFLDSSAMSSGRFSFLSNPAGTGDYPDKESLWEHIDKVSPDLVAALLSAELRKDAPTFAKPMLEMTVPNSSVTFPLRSDDDYRKRVQRKGLPHSRVVGNPKMKHVVKQLVKEGMMFKSNAELLRQFLALGTEEERRREGFYNAGVFTVDKTSFHPVTQLPLRRIITDGREANARLQNLAPMELFTLELLQDTVARNFNSVDSCMYHSNFVHMISADLRHWFHQIPMPWKLSKHYSVQLDKYDVTTSTLFFPITWPMGASPAPGIGQAATWSLLLAELDDWTSPAALAERDALGIVWDKKKNFDLLLTWLPLEGGGGIFVLIDNIFIITRNPVYADRWCQRLKDVAKKYNAQLKRENENDPNDEGVYHKTVPVGSADTTHMDFSGIEFSAAGRRPKRPLDPEKDATVREIVEATGEWTTTYRKLASIVSQCLWMYRVRGIKMCDEQMSPYVAVCGKCYPPSNDGWDLRTTLTGDVLSNLKEMVKFGRSVNFTPYKGWASRRARTLLYLATDAHYKKETGEAGWGYVWQDDFPRARVHSNRSAGVLPGSQIALEELRAVVWALKEIRAVRGALPDVVMLAIDSNHVRGMIKKGFARTEEGRSLLRDLDAVLGDSRLYMLYVESKKNPADAPSRQLPLVFKLWSELREKMSDHKRLVLDYFTQTRGGHIGERRDRE